MQVGIVAQRGNARAATLAVDIRDRLESAEVSVALDEATADTVEETGHDVSTMDACDLVVSIGGDGTFLYAARGAGSTPVMGVNLGEVGFLNSVSPEDAVETIVREVSRFRESGSIQYREAPRATVSGPGDWELSPALNEISIQGHQRGHANGVSLEIRVDGDLYSSGHADGVLVATPTGSTAYNLSEGGPLIHPSIGGFVVTDMSGSGTMPPLVVPLDVDLGIRVADAEQAVVSSDGSEHQAVELPVELSVSAAPEPARVAGPGSNFFQALNKLE